MVVAKRLCDAARGGQILAGDVVATLVGSRRGFTFRPVGRVDLKGLSRPVPAVEVLVEPAVPAEPVRGPGRGVPGRPRRAAPRGPDLVGRGDELTLLADEFARSAAGEFHCVLLVGEPGVGKTRLAAELTARQEAAATVLHARARPMAASVAFGLWAEALEPFLELLGADEVADLCGGFLDDLAGLFHAVAAVRGSSPPVDAPRPRLLAGLSRLVAGLAQRTPLIVVLDDVHWADPSSWTCSGTSPAAWTTHPCSSSPRRGPSSWPPSRSRRRSCSSSTRAGCCAGSKSAGSATRTCGTWRRR